MHNVLISIALPQGAEPTISEAPSNGSYSLNPDTSRLDWVLDEVSEAAGTTNGSLEFEVDGDDTDAFFPVVVDFISQKGLCGVEVRSRECSLASVFVRKTLLLTICSALTQVLSVTNPADGAQVDYSLDSLVGVEKYEVV